jgi:hypothetical protein
MKNLTLEIISENNTEYGEYVPCEKVGVLLIDGIPTYKFLVTNMVQEKMCMAATRLFINKESVVMCNPNFYQSSNSEDLLRLCSHEIAHIELGHCVEYQTNFNMDEKRVLEIELEADEYASKNFTLGPTVELYNRTFGAILGLIGPNDPVEYRELVKTHLNTRVNALKGFE